MQTHYMEVTNNPGSTDDQNVTFTLIPEGGTQTSIWDQTTYPILTRYVSVNQNDVDITYKIYYIQLRQGTGANSKSPSNTILCLDLFHFELTDTSPTWYCFTFKSETSASPKYWKL